MKITWQSYVIEILIGGGMALYFFNYMFGRSRNSSVTQSWWVYVSVHAKERGRDCWMYCDFYRLDSQMDLLNRNFALVGERYYLTRNNNVSYHFVHFISSPFTDSHEHATSFISPATNILSHCLSLFVIVLPLSFCLCLSLSLSLSPPPS